MHWSPFVGAFVGAFVGVVAILGVVLVGEWLMQRREGKAVQLRPSAQRILERDLEEYIVEQYG